MLSGKNKEIMLVPILSIWACPNLKAEGSNSDILGCYLL